MQSFSTVLIVPVIALLSACSSSSSTPSLASDIQGRWTSDCLLDDDGDYEQEQFVFSGLNLTRSIVTYINSTDCSGTNYVSDNVLATFVVTGDVTSLPAGDAKHINLTFSNGTITAGADALAQLAAGGTTLQDVATNEGVADINNVPLEAIGIPTELYTIYRIDSTELRIGDELGTNDGSTTELRHPRLAINDRYTKQ